MAGDVDQRGGADRTQGSTRGTNRSYWLMKSEPDEASIDDLQRAGVLPWTGVRNYQARNFMRDRMAPGDGVLFYHSSTRVPGIYGLASVASAPYPDPTQFDRSSKYHDAKATVEAPRWQLVDVRFVERLDPALTLARIREHVTELGEDFALIRRGNRLSILPVTTHQWRLLCGLAGARTDL